ncbi:hypothetical protein F7R91_24910 [Streptomyces luteolifulvus]|jgi:hypothetical protein|uniref:Uncharacterized protein n=1 Tax=Streptomyces luteolifulvus TaxID=2615112 RepID=A0A6H9UWN1_9ACTN|nr:hypothetical protein [Streptomyces luteolifulvus]KAB1143431.1 hypothetical protein F7R91_24910 [Streptomyces luteolifulvus]
MIFVAVGYLTAWLVFTLLGFWKFKDPKRQVVISGSLIAIAVALTFGLLRSASLGAVMFGIGVIATLVRLTRGWSRLPVNRPH